MIQGAEESGHPRPYFRDRSPSHHETKRDAAWLGLQFHTEILTATKILRTIPGSLLHTAGPTLQTLAVHHGTLNLKLLCPVA